MSPFINPYNFAPLPSAVRRENILDSPVLRLMSDNLHSGWLKVEIITLTRLALPSQLPEHQRHQKVSVTIKGAIQERNHIIFTKFLEDSQGRKMIPGTSWKGPVRAVMEALSDSCLSSDKPLPNKTSEDYQACVLPNLCLCCRLFGAAGGESQEAEESQGNAALQGRLVFHDAVLADDSQGKVSKETIVLKELSSPKPRHRPFYYDSHRPRGRKFYLHQQENRANYEEDIHKKERRTHRNRSLEETVLPGARFEGRIQFTNLTESEIGLLLWGLELDEVVVSPDQAEKLKNLRSNFLAHKLGLGKPLGLGSVKIRVISLSFTNFGDRYQTFTWPESSTTIAQPKPPEQLCQTILALKNNFSPDPFQGRDQLHHLLTFPYPLISDTLSVHYPSNSWFKKECPDMQLPENGVLPDSCSGDANVPPYRERPAQRVPSRRQNPSSRPSLPPPHRTEEKVVEVKRLEGAKAIVEVEGQELPLSLPPYVVVGPGQRLKIKINHPAEGRLKAEFKKRL